MVGRSYSLNMCEVEAKDLRIALYEMKEEVERLQDELEAEREATATSASEAMSMILRLQGEKATFAMEARQYKRMVEEKMSHAEMSLELLEDLYNFKDVEIKNLECELHAHRCKLMNLGIDNSRSTDDMRCFDRSQTPSPEPIDVDFSVPVEKEVVIEHSSTRHHEMFKKLGEQLKELMQFTDSISSSNIKDMSKESSSKQKKERSLKRDHTRGSCSAKDTEYQTELRRLKERIERLERERHNKEPETKISRTTTLPRDDDDSAIVDVQEAMLYFWL